ncbi:MAG TPA: HdeD family acid-resistance protein [Aestuariivirga sp.]
MKQYLAKYWWIFLLRGIFSVIFGVLAFVMPGLTIATLVIIWGAYALVDGVFSLWASATGGTKPGDHWLVGLQGLIGLAAGIITLIMPGVTALGLLIAIAAYSLVVGVLQIAAAIKLRQEIEGEFWLGLSGVISILFGMFIIARPGEGALAVIWIIGTYALIFGVFLVSFAFRIKGRGQTA